MKIADMRCCFCHATPDRYAIAVPNKDESAYLCNLCILESMAAVIKAANVNAYTNHRVKRIVDEMHPVPREFEAAFNNIQDLLA